MITNRIFYILFSLLFSLRQCGNVLKMSWEIIHGFYWKFSCFWLIFDDVTATNHFVTRCIKHCTHWATTTRKALKAQRHVTSHVVTWRSGVTYILWFCVVQMWPDHRLFTFAAARNPKSNHASYYVWTNVPYFVKIESRVIYWQTDRKAEGQTIAVNC